MSKAPLLIQKDFTSGSTDYLPDFGGKPGDFKCISEL